MLEAPSLGATDELALAPLALLVSLPALTLLEPLGGRLVVPAGLGCDTRRCSMS